jgi:hypothetical protein
MAGTVRGLVLFAVFVGLIGCTPATTPVPNAPPISAAGGAEPPSPVARDVPGRPQSWPLGPPPSADDAAAQLARLEKDPGPIKSNWVPPGKSDRYGHAEGLVAAPYDVVRAKLLDFPHYRDLAGPKFKNVRVVAKEGTTTDLYFNLPIMKGLFTLWYVTRFTPPEAAQGGEVLEGNFVKGNIRGMHIAFTVRRGRDDKSTVLTCDLLLRLSIPAPQSNVDEELRDACGDAINNVRLTTAPPPPPPPPPAPASPSPSPPP